MTRLTPALIASLVVAAAHPAAGSASTVVTARDPQVAIMGRVAIAGDGSAQLAFPGSVIRFAYRGPAPVIQLEAASEDCYFNLSVDGWSPVTIRLRQGANAITLPTGVAPKGGYVIELTRRTEAWQGIATFRGLELPEGCSLLAPPPWPSRRLMFIGDSMTCGQYIDRLPPENDATPRTSNAARSFGMLLGRQLAAQVHLVSYGGRGVMRDWEGKTDTGTAPQFFERALPDDPGSRWDHTSYQPHAIVVCLGQNDLSTGLPDPVAYLDLYLKFVVRLREVHPQAAIVLAESAMHGEEPGSEDAKRRAFLRTTLDDIVALRRAAGDKRVIVAPVRKAPGTVHDSHPVAFQHEQIAQQLVGPIKELTGW